jgi:ABC-type sulfate transport system permease component
MTPAIKLKTILFINSPHAIAPSFHVHLYPIAEYGEFSTPPRLYTAFCDSHFPRLVSEIIRLPAALPVCARGLRRPVICADRRLIASIIDHHLSILRLVATDI